MCRITFNYISMGHFPFPTVRIYSTTICLQFNLQEKTSSDNRTPNAHAQSSFIHTTDNTADRHTHTQTSYNMSSVNELSVRWLVPFIFQFSLLINIHRCLLLSSLLHTLSLLFCTETVWINWKSKNLVWETMVNGVGWSIWLDQQCFIQPRVEPLWVWAWQRLTIRPYTQSGNEAKKQWNTQCRLTRVTMWPLHTYVYLQRYSEAIHVLNSSEWLGRFDVI